MVNSCRIHNHQTCSNRSFQDHFEISEASNIRNRGASRGREPHIPMYMKTQPRWPAMVACLHAILSLANIVQAQLLHPTDFIVLNAVKSSMNDLPGGNFFNTWDFSFSVDPCQLFTGVQCVNIDGLNRVSCLSLGPQTAGVPGLSGSLTPSLGSLLYLTELTVGPGAVRGVLPESLGNLQNLELLSTSQNYLSGGIPTNFADLRSLRVLDLSRNNFDGSIPLGVGQLPAASMVILSDNSFSGSIPKFVSSGLTHLDLRNNDFSGDLPTFPASLQYLSLTQNSLSGGIGALVGLTSLKYLDLSFNQFSGPIPSVAFTFPLSFLLLNHNLLSGAVAIPEPVTIPAVDLSHNHLQGEISPYLAGAQTLFLNNNFFTGLVPQDFVSRMESATLQTLYLQHNYLTDFGGLEKASLPTSVAVCVQYNCALSPPQSLCPDNIGTQGTRPGYQCLDLGTHS